MDTIEKMYETRCTEPNSDMGEHMATLRRYGEQCDHITELGVFFGKSIWAWLAARPQRGIFACDIRRDENIDMIEAAAKKAGIPFTFAEADSKTIEIGPTDLLFIDSLHTYKQLSAELALHAGKARKWIILHDTVTFDEWCRYYGADGRKEEGIGRAWREFLAGHSEWQIKEQFDNCCGLLVLERVA